MNRKKNPIKKSVIRICAATFSFLCIGMMILNYVGYRRLLYSQYENHMKNILTNTVCFIDVDDLAECIRTGEESPKYYELQKVLDEHKDSTDLNFLYIIIPLNTEPTDNIRNVIAAMSKEEYETIPDELVKLNSLTGDSYSPAVAAKYLEAYESGRELSYFRDVTEWGDNYTALMPLYDSKGERVAALCVDIEISEIRSQLLYHSLWTIGITLFGGILVSVLFFLWTRKNVLQPILKIEKSLNDYTARGMNLDDPESLIIDIPDIHTGNEVEDLADDILFMSETLCVTVQDMHLTRQELAHMSVKATKDELTHVGNKVAYKESVDHLQQSIDNGTAEFAIVIADTNRLKIVNDTFGHEKGDAYIRICCGVLCEVFQHSPVYRIGGDEFVIILTGNDYDRRTELFAAAKQRFLDMQEAPDAEPWTAASMALGMAVFSSDFDKDVKQVFTRADKNMYDDKAKWHQMMAEHGRSQQK
jgi:diguanylate cyclase (GGDEF)-like protein